MISHPELIQKNGITELEVFVPDAESIEKLVQVVIKSCPDLNLTVQTKLEVLNKKLMDLFLQISCCLEFDFESSFLDEKKKLCNKKVSLLNESGLVFGFLIDSSNFSTMKRFRACLDEAISYYPNHIYIENSSLVPTDKLSTQDIKNIRNLSFALDAFYSNGRAVPWFLAVTNALRLRPSVLLSDFAEWQRCNNCGQGTGFDLEKTSHAEIEKMQLAFLKLKFEEKHLNHVFTAASDLIKLHGALSRCDCEGQESLLELSYNPEDLLSPYAMDLVSFSEETCMEFMSVKIVMTEFGANFITQ
ncbi:MAG: hypothetical protein K6G52_03435 [Treponemataceae bacterium]|nr:hypothetical protein [Treponemataceae bacterium]